MDQLLVAYTRQPNHQKDAIAKRLVKEEISARPNQILPLHPIHRDSSNRITGCDFMHIHAIFPISSISPEGNIGFCSI
jgi:hypothetical protein